LINKNLIIKVKTENPKEYRKAISVCNSLESDDHMSIVELESTSSDSSLDCATKIRNIAGIQPKNDDQRKTFTDEFETFNLTPLKNALNDVNQVNLHNNAIDRFNSFKKRLEIPDTVQEENNFIVENPLPEHKCSNAKCKSICEDCRKTAVYIQSASIDDRELCENDHDIALSLAAILKNQTIGFSSWNENILHEVLEA